MPLRTEVGRDHKKNSDKSAAAALRWAFAGFRFCCAGLPACPGRQHKTFSVQRQSTAQWDATARERFMVVLLRFLSRYPSKMTEPDGVSAIRFLGVM